MTGFFMRRDLRWLRLRELFRWLNPGETPVFSFGRETSDRRTLTGAPRGWLKKSVARFGA
ncbi:MAG: hypothetical protein Fues2KO_52380 [Fuerstiella sp.]